MIRASHLNKYHTITDIIGNQNQAQSIPIPFFIRIPLSNNKLHLINNLKFKGISY